MNPRVMFWYCTVLRVLAILFIMYAAQEILTHPEGAAFLPIHQN